MRSVRLPHLLAIRSCIARATEKRREVFMARLSGRVRSVSHLVFALFMSGCNSDAGWRLVGAPDVRQRGTSIPAIGLASAPDTNFACAIAGGSGGIPGAGLFWGGKRGGQLGHGAHAQRKRPGA